MNSLNKKTRDARGHIGFSFFEGKMRGNLIRRCNPFLYSYSYLSMSIRIISPFLHSCIFLLLNFYVSDVPVFSCIFSLCLYLVGTTQRKYLQMNFTAQILFVCIVCWMQRASHRPIPIFFIFLVEKAKMNSFFSFVKKMQNWNVFHINI